MKIRNLFILAVILVFSYSVAWTQSVTLDNVTGLYASDTIPVNQEVTFNIRFTNPSVAQGGLTNGFTVYSPDGATWGSTIPDTLSFGWSNYFDLVFQIKEVNVDGMGADTVGVGGSKIFKSGLPAGFDEVAFTITVGPIDPSEHGKTLVLDSAWYPPTGVWKWVPASGVTWDGPHAFVIHDPDFVPANTPPVLTTIGPKSVDEGVTLSFDVFATDAESTPSLSAAVLPQGATFVDNQDGSGHFEWTPAMSDAGEYFVTFTASDGEFTDDELVSITVNDVNQAPVLNFIGDQVVDENTELVINIVATDPDEGDNIDISVAPLPTGASLTPTGYGTATFSWTPTYEMSGAYVITFSVTDDDLTDSESIQIIVNNVNRLPVISNLNSTPSVLEGDTVFISFDVSDPDGDQLDVNVSPAPPNGIEDINGNSYTYKWPTTFDDAGNYDFTISVSDYIDIVQETVSVEVINVNQPPVLDPIGDKAVIAGDLLEFIVTASDPDGTIPAISAPVIPPNATFVDNNDGTALFSWQTTVNDNGQYPVTFTASDNDLSVDEFITITVGDAPKYLVVSPTSLSFELTLGVNEQTSSNLTVFEQNGFTVNFDGYGGGGATWLDLNGFAGGKTPSEITVNVDASGLTAGQYSTQITFNSFETINQQLLVPVDLIVHPKPNTPPVFTSVFETDYLMSECDTLEINITSSDDDQDILVLGFLELMDGMTLTDNGDGTGLFTFTPSFTQAGIYPLTAFVTDIEDTAFASFSITVDECEPGTEGDTVMVGSIVTVPGAQITIPVNFANLCNLNAFDISLSWTSELIDLDSVSFSDSRLTIPYSVNIDNDAFTFSITDITDPQNLQENGSGNLVNLHFSLGTEIPHGFYPLDLHFEPSYTRDCGGGLETVRPYFIPGNIAVDTDKQYVCGYVLDATTSLPVPNATVELWDDYPSGTPIMTTTANGNGVFAFHDFTTIPYDIYAYSDGYLPNSVENINYDQKSVTIELTPTAPYGKSSTWVVFRCTEGTSTYLDAPLPVGTVVEAFVAPRSDVKCGEFTVSTEGIFGPMYVYGEDNTENPIPGARPGEAIAFFVNGVPAIPSATPIWTQDRDIHEVCLDVPNEITHSCTLFEGWNLVSWNVDTESDDIMTVLSSIEGCLELVMGFEQGAQSFDINLPMFSDLWQVDHMSGYWIKVNCDVDLNVVGTPVMGSTPINLTAGWNLVSYLPVEPLATDVALASIMDELIIASGFDGTNFYTFVPDQPQFNDLNFMGPCLGYWVKVRNDVALVYEGGALVKENRPLAETKSTYKTMTPTNQWVNLYSYDLTLNGAPISNGAEINAYNMDGLLVGSYTMNKNGQFGFMHVYGDDPTTVLVDGLKSGEKFYLTVDGQITDEQFVWSSSGDKVEIAALTSSTSSDDLLPGSYALYQNYPNPFNPTTTIMFNLPISGQAKLEVFNLLGELVATPFDGIGEAGVNQVIWDGKNSSGKSVSSGIYFYRLTADNYTETKKMTLIK